MGTVCSTVILAYCFVGILVLLSCAGCCVLLLVLLVVFVFFLLVCCCCRTSYKMRYPACVPRGTEPRGGAISSYRIIMSVPTWDSLCALPTCWSSCIFIVCHRYCMFLFQDFMSWPLLLVGSRPISLNPRGNKICPESITELYGSRQCGLDTTEKQWRPQASI